MNLYNYTNRAKHTGISTRADSLTEAAQQLGVDESEVELVLEGVDQIPYGPNESDEVDTSVYDEYMAHEEAKKIAWQSCRTRK